MATRHHIWPLSVKRCCRALPWPLNRLIAEVDIEEMFFSNFKITDITPTQMTGFVYGEPIAPEKGETLVKAVTYHQYKFEKTADGYKVRVSFDI